MRATALAPPPLLLLLLAAADVVGALDNNLSLVPAMGFNNWDEMPLKYKPWLGGTSFAEWDEFPATHPQDVRSTPEFKSGS